MPKKKILIVEDDEILADIYSIKLKLEGYQVLVAKEGRQGIAEAIKQKPDLILLDIVLPEINGFDVLKKIKSDKKMQKIPVIFLSNLGQDYEIKKGLSLGAVKYLVKSDYTPLQVIREINEILKIY